MDTLQILEPLTIKTHTEHRLALLPLETTEVPIPLIMAEVARNIWLSVSLRRDKGLRLLADIAEDAR